MLEHEARKFDLGSAKWAFVDGVAIALTDYDDGAGRGQPKQTGCQSGQLDESTMAHRALHSTSSVSAWQTSTWAHLDNRPLNHILE